MRISAQQLLHRLRTAGIDAADDDELRMQKGLLALLGSLVGAASCIWLLIYWMVGPQMSSSLHVIPPLIIALNMLVYASSGNFLRYRLVLIASLLLFPFIAQWALGEYVSSMGLILWGILAPITALLCWGIREALAWFIAYLLLIVCTAFASYYGADVQSSAASLSPKARALFYALDYCTLSAIVFQCLRFSITERGRTRSLLEQAHFQLAEEQALSERLLLNILPEAIAHRLKTSNETIVDACPDATVMFADIVNFTEMASHLPPEEVFGILNHVFSQFDELTGQSGLEKIKTIGDAYMVAGGLQADSADACVAMADLALAMRGWLADDPVADEYGLRLRIGICTGPVVAGVVGRRKFIYDLWGDTVNLASRITSECPPGMIQCDSRTFFRLKYRFLFEDPVTLRLKGKGMFSVWRLLHRGQTVRENPRYSPGEIDFRLE